MRAQLLREELLALPARFETFVETFVEAQLELNRNIAARLERLEDKADRLEQGPARLEHSMKTLTDDVGQSKGIHAGNPAVGAAYETAQSMGCEHQRTLDRDQLRQISRGHTADWPRGQVLSFHQADLIIEATEAEEPVYITVEASYTVDERDTRRAMRNAEIPTRLTGKPDRAAVAGMRVNREVQELIEQGPVHWFDMEPDDLQPR